MLQDLSVSVSCRLCVSVFKQRHMLQVIKVSVFCRLSQCQYVARINVCKCVAGCHNVSMLQALTV